ncbi:MAG: hypothetical protein E7486_05000 [Ruminococcaceae bacterium]|nr:hypothetical protein [Oscillospiraceae bacterium]
MTMRSAACAQSLFGAGGFFKEERKETEIMTREEKLISAFRNMGKKGMGYHPSLPFWSWNDRLSPEEISRQIEEMADAHMGGFFMHAREGLESVYMGEEWFAAVKAAVETAKKRRMRAFIYDEDRWPSGAAGGLVTAGGDAYRMKALVICPEIGEEQTFDWTSWVTFRDGQILSLSDTATPAAKQIGFRVQIYDKCEWFNNDTYSDNMNPEAVRRFLDVVYEKYTEHCGDDFGKTVAGVFSDEPNVCNGRSVFSFVNGFLPWTDRFPEEFLCRRGYALPPLLPYLYYDGERSFKVRHDYWRTVAELFSESYVQQISRWCEERNLAFTGHFLYENDLGTATRCSGGVMRNYRYQHIPGVDLLTDRTDEYLTIKQCTSVAAQLGREEVISEMYGCTGWTSDFDLQKRLGDWQALMGINLRSQHLALYSLRGCRKRDFPPSTNYQTPSFIHNALLEDYFSRLYYLLDKSKPCRELLILHPQSTAWGMLGCAPEGPTVTRKNKVRLGKVDRYTDRVDEYGLQLNRLLRRLYSNGIDFDLGDETVMAELGSVDGRRLTVGACRYKYLLLPRLETILPETAELIRRFIAAGGKVLGLLPKPTRIDGEIANLSFLEGKQICWCGGEDELIDRLSRLERPSGLISAETDGVLQYILRRMGRKTLLFAINPSRETGAGGTFCLQGRSVRSFDCMTGSAHLILVEQKGEGVSFRISLAPGESVVLLSGGDREEVPLTRPEQMTAVQKLTEWSYSLEQNCYLFDRFSADCDGIHFPENDLWQIQRKVREHLGMRQVYYNGLPQRYRWADQPHPKDGTPLTLQTSFRVETLLEGELFLVLERGEEFSVSLNGIPAGKPEGYFLDRSFSKIPLRGIRQGRNTLVISCAYANHFELEDCFLLGRFGVDLQRRLTELPKSLTPGDWCRQGLFHFAGTVRCSGVFSLREEKRTFLSVPRLDGAVARIFVNGAPCGYVLSKEPEEFEVTGLVRQGENTLEIELVSTLRNLLGPFHLAGEDPDWTDWMAFRPEGHAYSPDYRVTPFGITDAVWIRQEF